MVERATKVPRPKLRSELYERLRARVDSAVTAGKGRATGDDLAIAP